MNPAVVIDVLLKHMRRVFLLEMHGQELMFWGRSGVGQELWPIAKSVVDPLLAIGNALIGRWPPFTVRLRQDCTSAYVTKTGSISNSPDGLGSQASAASMNKNLLDFLQLSAQLTIIGVAKSQ
jgi:hypothetical protein